MGKKKLKRKKKTRAQNTSRMQIPVHSMSMTSTKKLPTITVSSGLNADSFTDDRNGFDTSVNQETLFADVYKDKKKYEDVGSMDDGNTKSLVDSYRDTYLKMKRNQNDSVTDEYGFSSKREITFLSREERNNSIQSTIGKAPKKFSLSTDQDKSPNTFQSKTAEQMILQSDDEEKYSDSEQSDVDI